MRRAAFFVAFLLFGGGVLLVGVPAGFNLGLPNWPDWNLTSDPDDAAASDDTSGEDGDDDGTGVGGDTCVPGDVVGEYLAQMGFGLYGEGYLSGAGNIDWDILPDDHVDHAFSSPLRSERAVRNFLDGDSASSRKAHRLIGGGDATVDDWVPVQFKRPVHYSGNWNWHDNTASRAGNLRVPAGDVWWFGVDTDACEIDLDASVRAACGNVGVTRIEPIRKND